MTLNQFSINYAVFLICLTMLIGCSEHNTHDLEAATFTVSPIDLSNVRGSIPLGNLNPPGHTFPTDHIYFSFADASTYPPPYEVRAVADGEIIWILYHRQEWNPESGHTGTFNDYKVVFRHTPTLQSYFGHVAEFTPEILHAVGTLQEGGNTIHLKVKAGDLIGYTGGRPRAIYAFDFGVVDASITLKGFINPSRYPEDTLHCASPFDYFAEPLKAQLLAKNPRTLEPRGGKIDFDIDGRLVGNWFLENTTDNYEWSRHLAFVYDNLHPTEIRVAIGGILALSPGVYGVRGNAPDPKSVDGSTGRVKYELVNARDGQSRGILLVQVRDERTIQVEVFPDKSPDDVFDFTANAKIYVR